MPHYTEYQYFLYETISKLREKGMTFNQIAEHLNKKKILSARAKNFKGGHVHSIIKRKRARDNYRNKKSGGGYKKTRRVGKINKLKKGGFRKTRNK